MINWLVEESVMTRVSNIIVTLLKHQLLWVKIREGGVIMWPLKNGFRPRNLCIPDNLDIPGNVEGYASGRETSRSFRNELKLGHPQGDFIEKRTQLQIYM